MNFIMPLELNSHSSNDYIVTVSFGVHVHLFLAHLVLVSTPKEGCCRDRADAERAGRAVSGPFLALVADLRRSFLRSRPGCKTVRFQTS